ncbi:MAG: ABC transporter permease [Hyphomicrobiales bacterium]|nr:ABC transporter permease [Hyphomicrobiales bacterium]
MTGARSMVDSEESPAKPGWISRSRATGVALVPAASIAGRTLVTVVAIMTFLASLAAGGAVLISQTSRDWRSAVSREATIQVRPVPGRDIEADVREAVRIAAGAPGVESAQPLSKHDSEALLEPWLGQGAALDDIPVPRMIVVKLASRRTVDFAALRDQLLKSIPTAALDDHRMWSERLADMANVLVAITLVLLALLVTAMALAVSFATHGAMAGNREIIEVLHFVGASDGFIARQFQRRFLSLGLRGGMIGAAGACFVFLAAGLLSRRLIATPSGEQLEALFGSFSLGVVGYAAVVAIALVSAALCGQTSRVIVFRRLRNLS